jgi:diadenosine tetraphosphate (Ap4A) HIT family hydrolase
MSQFQLDQRLSNDCHPLFEWEGIEYLLHRNAEVVWFILVPHTTVSELFLLDEVTKKRLYHQVDRLSEFVELHFEVDKINVASIGNVVAQLHVHVVGRRRDDIYWPNVIWGQPFNKGYEDEEVHSIRQSLVVFLNSSN